MTAAAALAPRTITGRIAIFDTDGNTSGGRTQFARGSIVVPSPISKVKLLVAHNMNEPIGYMTDYQEDEQGITATFTVAETEAGDKALAEAKAGIRDGLSVGARITQVDQSARSSGLLRVTASQLYEVSLVSVPAYENTLVQSVTAQYNNQEKNMTTEEQQPAPEAPAATEEQQPAAPAAVTAAINSNPFAATGAQDTRPVLEITAAADRLIQAAQDGENIGNVMAALQDVVPANDAGQAWLKKFWVGQLWTASVAERPMIEAFGTPGKLTGLQAYGWKWADGKTPVVGKYASNKTEIPSNQLATVEAVSTAQDFAAGWDIARKYIDLGATGMVESIFQLATDDYRRQTEAWFTSRVLAQATTKTGYTSPIDAMKKLPREMNKIGAKVSKIFMGETLFDAFLDLPDNAVPWWLKNQGSVDLSDAKGVASNVSVEFNRALGANDVLALDSRAATYYENSAQPIRVQAIELAKGGIDIAVFGYAAEIVHDKRAIIKATVTAPAA